MVQRYDVDWCQQEEYKDDEGPWVTYEDYQKLEAELEELRQQVAAPADGGWIEWAGGEQPVDKGVQVRIKYRSGREAEDYAGCFNWSASGRIIAYRVVKPC